MARTEVVAEMAGTVREVLVSVGESVSTGQELIILESMKMEVPVESPAAGQVVEVAVEVGTVVEEGRLLLAIE